MLLSIKSLGNYEIEATDGSIGHVHSFLFDERNWTVRYLVVDTGKWLPGRKVLIAPAELGKPEGTAEVFPVDLTKEQVKNSPDINTEKPVSRQQEIELYKYYNWAPYWAAGYEPVTTPYTPVVPEDIKEEEEKKGSDQDEDPHLRSTREILKYKIHAEDGEIGHVDDFIADIESWVIRYIVVDTRDLLPGKKVIIPPDWTKEISWSASEVSVNVTKDMIKDSPEFDPSAPVNREYETQLYDYYGRPKYWV